VSTRAPAEPPIAGVVSDLDGVVYRGAAAIPGAVETFRHWHARGVPYAFVTNNSTKSAADFAAKIAGLGIPVEAAHVVPVVTATADLVARRLGLGGRVLAVGNPALFEALDAAGLLRATSDVEAVVVGHDDDFDFAKLTAGVRALLGGAFLVGTNPDPLTPSEHGFDPCVGALLAAFRAAAPRAESLVVGKPEPHMLLDALARIGTPAASTVMIGDQLATDILAGRRAGLRTILVTTGVPNDPINGLAPDRTIARLTELVAA
jgi:4-nitrophenyl phosphatase